MKTFASRLVSAVATVVVLAASWCPAAGVSVVFVSRHFDPSGTSEGPVVRAASGALRVATLDDASRQWVMRDLVDAALEPGKSGVPVDVADPDVSYDAARIVFAGYSEAEGAWRIFEVGADGSGLRQITTSDRSIADLEERYGAAASRFRSYDDVDPCYLPDSRICFVSTRYPGFAPGERKVATNLYVVNADGTDVHRITSERFGADSPAVDPSTGEIAYSRWWLTAREATPPSGGTSPDRPPAYYGPVTNPNNFSSTVLRGIEDSAYEGVNNWFIATIRPDGSEMTMRTGFGLNRELTMAYRPSFLGSGELVVQFITESPVLNQRGQNGLRLLGDAGAAELPRALGGPQSFDGSGTLQDPTPGAPVSPPTQPQFVYHGASPFGPDLLVSVSLPSRGRNADRDIYVQSLSSGVPVYLFGAPDVAELDAVALAPRALPPVIADRAPRLDFEVAPRTVAEAVELGGTFTFKAENIFANGPVDDLRIASAPPVGRDLVIEFYMNPQREGTTSPEPPILIASRPIPPDGKVEVELPAGVPLFEVLRRPDGRIALGRDGQAFHVGGMNFGVRDAVSTCVGCHAGHSQLPVADGDEAAWTNVAPSALVTEVSAGRPDPRANGLVFPPEVLVDRLTSPVASEWAASSTSGVSTLRLRWIRPIHAREAVIYGTKHAGGQGLRSQVIERFKVETHIQDLLLSRQDVSADVLPEGTRVPLDPSIAFDNLTITIDPRDVRGVFEGEKRTALAEVEVIGKAYGSAPPTIVFIRGDVDCNTQVNITDAIALLNSLFLGAGSLCCEASADAAGEGWIDIGDAIHLLNYLYQGATPLTLECERATGLHHTCEQETCP